MPRLDARIKTELSAFVSPFKGGTERVSNVVDLSLSGLLLDGLITKAPVTCHLRLPLRENDHIYLYGDIIRIKDSKSAVQFYVPERETSAKLWDFIRSRITYQNRCPYCDYLNISNSDHCGKCGSYLNFKDEHYLDKHLDKTIVHRIMKRMGDLSTKQRQQVLNFIDKEALAIKDKGVDEHFVGASENMLEVFSLIRKIAPTENTVLILGENGTGKNLTAETIHKLSQRKAKPLIAINCSEIPETLIEAELFGYKKSALNDALTSEKGKFEIAKGGTVFLDELTALPLSLQVRVLRLLEEGIMERLGDKEGIKANVRVLASSSKILEQEVREHRFRSDLYRRMKSFTITLPPLRDRGEDRIILAQYYLRTFCMSAGITKRFSEKAIEAMRSYSWPGNIQELISKIRRAIVVTQGEEITPKDLSLAVPSIKDIASLKETKALIEKQKLIEVLEMASHNISKASALLGVSRPTVYALIRKYGIDSTDV